MKKKILIIDDEVPFTRMLKMNLEKTGNYEVCEENISEDAVKTAKAFKPDLIFLDVIMPRMFGGDIAVKLKAEPELERVPIVFLTAYVKRRLVEEHDGYISGYPFLAKPASLEEIIDAIEKNIAKNQSNT